MLHKKNHTVETRLGHTLTEVFDIRYGYSLRSIIVHIRQTAHNGIPSCRGGFVRSWKFIKEPPPQKKKTFAHFIFANACFDGFPFFTWYFFEP